MKKIARLHWLIVVSCCVAANVFAREQLVTVDLPHYRLHFTLPDSVVMPPWKSPDAIFDSTNPSFQRDGFRTVAEAFADFNGPFWVGTRGSFRVSFGVVRLSPKFSGGISTTDSLERYVRWWIGSSSPEYGFDFDRVILHGIPWVRRFKNTFGQSSIRNKESNEILSYPLDDTMFLDVGIHITEWIPDTSVRWKGKAEAFRTAILESISVEKKPSQAL